MKNSKLKAIIFLSNVFLFAVLFLSCKKIGQGNVTDDITIRDLPEKEFILKVTEYPTGGVNPSINFVIGKDCLPMEYDIASDGSSSCEKYGLDELVLSGAHLIVIDTGETAVNVESSAPEVVTVERIDALVDSVSRRITVLKYMSDGFADISVWNGQKGGSSTTTFKVKAQEIIPLEALTFELDGKEQRVTRFFSSKDEPMEIDRQLGKEIHEDEKLHPERSQEERWQAYRDFYDTFTLKVDNNKTEQYGYYRLTGVIPANTSYVYFSECRFKLQHGNKYKDNVYGEKGEGGRTLCYLVNVEPQFIEMPHSDEHPKIDLNDVFTCTILPGYDRQDEGMFMTVNIENDAAWNFLYR